MIALLLAITLDEPVARPSVDGAAATSTPIVSQPAPNPPVPAGLRLPAVAKEEPSKALRFVWREHPSLRAGRLLRLDFGVKIQEDGRDPGDDPVDFKTWQLHRARASVDGELFRKLQFSIEREFSERDTVEESGRPRKSQWKDVWVEANFSNALQIRVGKFKVPYGLDQISGESELDFVHRSLGGDYLSPGRDIGAMIHGRFYGRRLNYSFGGFKQDGDNSRSRKIAGGDTTFAGRVTTRPFTSGAAPGIAEVGVSLAATDLSDESLLPNGLRGRTVMSDFTFFEPVFVKGTRRRFGVDVDWTKGPAGARAEYMLASDTRIDQGLGNQDLPNARGRAYYVLGTWVLTGERKTRPVEAKNNGLGRGGIGALELVARFDRLWFDSKPGTDAPFRNSRAETILPSGDKVTTIGMTYYANRFVKIQINGIRERLQDPERSPLPEDKPFWSSVVRFQVGL